MWRFIREITASLGCVAITGVLLGIIMSHRQLKSFYQNELGELIFGHKFLRARTDIADVWRRVSNTLFCSKFPAINDKLLDIVSKTYLSSEMVTYYDDYENIIKIEWDSQNPDFIIVTDEASFRLIADSEKEFPFSQDHWAGVGDNADANEYYSTMYASVDYKPHEEIKGAIVDGKLHTKWETKLSGSKEYHITKKATKRYNFAKDYYLGFRAKYITNNLKTTIIHPDDMDVICIERGTQYDFKCDYFTPTCCEFQYKGLILPRQGYVIILNKK